MTLGRRGGSAASPSALRSEQSEGGASAPAGKETVEHTFKDCRRSRLLWNKVIDAWRETTGETKMKSTDGRVILLGDRASHWLPR